MQTDQPLGQASAAIILFFAMISIVTTGCQKVLPSTNALSAQSSVDLAGMDGNMEIHVRNSRVGEEWTAQIHITNTPGHRRWIRAITSGHQLNLPPSVIGGPLNQSTADTLTQWLIELQSVDKAGDLPADFTLNIHTNDDRAQHAIHIENPSAAIMQTLAQILLTATGSRAGDVRGEASEEEEDFKDYQQILLEDLWRFGWPIGYNHIAGVSGAPERLKNAGIRHLDPPIATMVVVSSNGSDSLVVAWRPGMVLCWRSDNNKHGQWEAPLGSEPDHDTLASAADLPRFNPSGLDGVAVLLLVNLTDSAALAEWWHPSDPQQLRILNALLAAAGLTVPMTDGHPMWFDLLPE